jgi:hypothetical protein
MHGVIPATSRASVTNSSYAFALAAVFAYAVFIFVPAVLNDGDTYSHLATGQWILAHGTVPSTDPFSYSFAGAPWVAHEWLAELLSALAFRLAGWSGLVMLFGAGMALTAGLMAAHLRRWLTPLAAFVALLLGIACVAPSMLARPHILALPALELWTAGLLIARARNAAPSWWLLPVITIWANLHGSFVFGLALAAPVALEAVVEAPGQRVWVAGRWAAFILGGVGAALLTPHGVEGLRFPFQLMHMSMLFNVGEWAPTNFGTPQPMEMAAAALLYVLLTRGIRLPVIRVLLLFGLTYLAMQHARHQMLLGIVGPLLIAQPLGEALRAGAGESARAKPPQSRLAWRGPLAWGLAVVVALCAGAARIAWPVMLTDRPTAPITALAHVPPAIAARPVFNEYAFGGYLIYRGIPPVIDARIDMYGDSFARLYLRATHPDRAALEELVGRYHIGWTILAPSNPAVALLDMLPGWHRIYADNVAVVHVRDDPRL